MFKSEAKALRTLSSDSFWKAASSFDGLIVCVEPGKRKAPDFPKSLGEAIIARAKQLDLKWEAGDSLTLDTSADQKLVVVVCDNKASMFEDLKQARGAVGPLKAFKTKKIGIDTSRLNDDVRSTRMAEAFVAALFAARFSPPSYKSEKPDKTEFKPDLTLVASGAVTDKITSAALLALANNLVRELTVMPANELTCKNYVQRAKKEATARGLKTTFHTFAKLQQMGAGAFLAVARGSDHRDAGILQIEYKGSGTQKNKSGKNVDKSNAKEHHVALVGKGIVFDTGGVNVKTGASMFGMHGDMAGSAVVLATILLAAEEQWPINITAFLAIADNNISNNAYRPNEVVKALDGTSIEVVHTDAEGRMCLADALVLAKRIKPDMIVDFATLTGAAVYAIGTRYSAGFTNKPDLHSRIVEAGKASGERVWTFPLDKDYGECLKSDIADTKQCRLSGGVDHIEAAMFLSKFVGDISWVHIDMSATEHDGGLAHIPTTVTGFGTRFMKSFLGL